MCDLRTATLLGLVMLLAACEDNPPPAAVARGQQLYSTYCALCHGPRGEGQASPRANALANPEFLAAASDELIRAALVNGRPGTSMSDFVPDPLDEVETEDVIAFLRSWTKGPPAVLDESPVTGDIRRGAQRYAALCSGCHGTGGQGAAYQSLANREFLRTVSPGYLRHAISRGRPGTRMPAFPGLGTDDFVAVILSWR